MKGTTEMERSDNPILNAFRLHPEFDWGWAFVSFDTFGGFKTWDNRDSGWHSFTLATPEQIEEARIVWASISEDN